MTDHIQSRTDSRWKTWGMWGLQILLALAFTAAGAQKLIGVQAMVDLFAQIGLGQWFRFVTGGLEIVAAALLLIPGTAIVGAALAACIMVGAVLTHLIVIGGSAIPALVLLCIAASIAWLRRPSTI